MSLWLTKREKNGNRSLFSVNMPVQMMIILIVLAVSMLMSLVGWLLRG